MKHLTCIHSIYLLTPYARICVPSTFTLLSSMFAKYVGFIYFELANFVSIRAASCAEKNNIFSFRAFFSC